MNFSRSIVVFVTVNPCTQPLHNYFLLARNRIGVAIVGIEDEDLGKLLKVNKLLPGAPAVDGSP